MSRCDWRLSAVLGTAALIAIGAPRPLQAQHPRPLSVDATIGGGYGRGGDHLVNRNATAVDALLGWRTRPARGGALLLGMSGAWHGNVGSDAVCHVAPSGGCAADYPSLTSVGVVGGWELRSARGRLGVSARGLAGPAYYHAGGSATLGAQARMDLATPALGPIALVASVRGAVLPRFRDQTLTLGAVGIGLRLQ
jgi:hypothetical protein